MGGAILEYDVFPFDPAEITQFLSECIEHALFINRPQHTQVWYAWLILRSSGKLRCEHSRQ
jgi:hypothetical protein